jgi:hypothetical protein
MIKAMKLLLVTAGFLLLFACACKLDPSSAKPNGNANANANANPTAEANDSSSQEPKSTCSLTAAAAPVVEELKLNMTPDEVLAKLPGSKDDEEVKGGLAKPPSPLGVSDFIVRANKLQPKEKYTNIDHFTFSLLDGRVTSINIGYNGPAYSHVDEFVTKFIKGTTLPPLNEWQGYPGLETQLKMLVCKDFEIRVFTGGEKGNQNYVLLSDLEAKKRLKDRRAKARAQASPTASP